MYTRHVSCIYSSTCPNNNNNILGTLVPDGTSTCAGNRKDLARSRERTAIRDERVGGRRGCDIRLGFQCTGRVGFVVRLFVCSFVRCLLFVCSLFVVCWPQTSFAPVSPQFPVFFNLPLNSAVILPPLGCPVFTTGSLAQPPLGARYDNCG
jgi:hypothetical protein